MHESKLTIEGPTATTAILPKMRHEGNLGMKDRDTHNQDMIVAEPQTVSQTGRLQPGLPAALETLTGDSAVLVMALTISARPWRRTSPFVSGTKAEWIV